MITIEREVYVLFNTFKEPIELSQGTDGIPVVFYFRDYDIPIGTTSFAFVSKPSGKAIQGDAVINQSNDTVTVNVVPQMTAEPGEAIIQVQLMQGGKNIFTFNHPLLISKSAIPINSENGSTFFDEYSKRIEKAIDITEAATDRANAVTDTMERKAQNGDFSATINVRDTVTGAPGTKATVKNSGNKKDAVFDFTIPQGMPGVSTSLSPGIFEMYVNTDGHLVLRHNDNEPKPPLSIENGRLIYKIS